MAQTAKVRSAAVVEAALQIGDDAANAPVILAYPALAYSVFRAGAAALFRRWFRRVRGYDASEIEPNRKSRLHRPGCSQGKPRPVRCLVILGLCLFVPAGLQAQTPDPTPLEAPQPGVRPPLSPFPRFQDWSF